MTATQLRNLPVNLRNRFGKEVLDEIEAMNFERRRDDNWIDEMMEAAATSVAAAEAQAVARLN